jgi:hypothetical protein
MAQRKPISKSVRFEVFKRDNFACQYCGASAPKAYLDGIAAALKVNDSRFKAPRSQFAEPVKGGRVVVSVLP